MQQQQRLQMVEIGMAGLADIRTLLDPWKVVVAKAAGQGKPSLVMKTYRQVSIEVEDRRLGEEVLRPS